VRVKGEEKEEEWGSDRIIGRVENGRKDGEEGRNGCVTLRYKILDPPLAGGYFFRTTSNYLRIYSLNCYLGSLPKGRLFAIP